MFVFVNITFCFENNDINAIQLTLFPHVDPPLAPEKYHKQKHGMKPSAMVTNSQFYSTPRTLCRQMPPNICIHPIHYMYTYVHTPS